MNTKIRYLTQTADGLYRYQRKVPLKLRGILRRDVWNFSLGRDQQAAIERWHVHKEAHDDLIARLKSGDAATVEKATADAVHTRTTDHLNRMERIHSEGPKVTDSVVRAALEELEEAAEGERQTVAGVQNLWSKTFDIMEDCQGSPQEYTRLTGHLAMAFGDQTYMREPVELPDMLRPVPPDGGGQKRMYEMMHSALLERLEEIAPTALVNEEHTLTHLREQYCKLNNHSPATQRSYTGKISSLIDKIGGDLPLTQITPEKLRVYRDHLLEEGLKPESVAQYFAPVKAIMRWAISEELVPGFDVMPTDKVKMPRSGVPIEESRWQRFDDDEIKRVWAIVQRIWGPESRYDPHRQESFKWAFRVALYTAARPVEIFRMKPENVTPDFINVTETKTRISRKLPLSKHLAGFYEFMQGGGWKLGTTKPESAAGTMSDSFTKAIRAAGFKNSRQVLYSTKDTLVAQLQRGGHSDDVIRGITGHVSGQGQLRNYKTRLNDTPEGLAMLRKALDGVVYW